MANKYTPQMNAQIKMDLFEVLSSASEYDFPTLDWIKTQSPALANISNQKLSMTLKDMIEMGTVRKAKQKSTGHMVYRLITGENDGC